MCGAQRCPRVTNIWASQVALVAKNAPANAGVAKRRRFDPWVRKIPWRRAGQPTPVFLPGESHGQRSLAGYSPQGSHSWTRLKHLSTEASTQLISTASLWGTSQLRGWFPRTAQQSSPSGFTVETEAKSDQDAPQGHLPNGADETKVRSI